MLAFSGNHAGGHEERGAGTKKEFSGAHKDEDTRGIPRPESPE